MNHLAIHTHHQSGYLYACKALRLSRTFYKSALFMQNKPNFLPPLINLTPVRISCYENNRLPIPRKNKPNQSQSQTPAAKSLKNHHRPPIPRPLHAPALGNRTTPHPRRHRITPNYRPTHLQSMPPSRLQIPTYNFLCSSPSAYFSCLLEFATSYNMLPLQSPHLTHFNEPVARPKRTRRHGLIAFP